MHRRQPTVTFGIDRYTARGHPLNHKWAWAVVGLAWLVLLGVTTSTGIDLASRDAIFAHENTWRDFPVYRQIALGGLPLEGPPTSIGGHHGFLGTWPFGLAMWISPTLRSLQAFSWALWLATGLVMFALARQSASGLATAVGLPILASTNLFLMAQFPSHIMLLPLTHGLALLGVVRARDGGVWPLVAGLGMAGALGSHRTGMVLVAWVVVTDLLRGRVLLRARNLVAWLPLAAYVGISLFIGLLDTPTVASGRPDFLQELGRMDPALVLRTMPFFHFDFMWAPVAQLAQLLTVLGAWGLAWRARDFDVETPHGLILGFYGAWFVALLLYKYDTHYLMPMLAALPAVLAMGFDAAVTQEPRAALPLAVWMAALHLGSAQLVQGTMREVLDDNPAGFRSITDDLAIVSALDAMGVSEEELYRRTWFEGRSPTRRLGWAHQTFSAVDHQAGLTADRCIHITADGAQGADAGRAAGSWRIQELPVPAGGCATNVERFGPQAWWLDLPEASLVRKAPGAPW